jgi:potassium-transporting ATPase KdpC subunit
MGMRREILTSVIALVLFTILLGVVYPLAVTGVSQVLFPGSANGSQIHVNGRLVGSRLIGQQFTDPVIGKDGKPEEEEEKLVTKPDPRYFQSRPSGTVPPDNAGATAFSNLGPNDRATKEAIEERVKTYLELEQPYVSGLTAAQVPVDAADSSASGIDPDISLANARIQAHRIAGVRHLTLAQVMELVSQHTDGRSLGILGESGVNVLELNLALNRMTGGH